MVIVGKILKWLGLGLLIFIVWIFMRNTIVNYLVTWTLQYEGMTMQKNEWREFDLDSIVGETPASLFRGTKQGQSILKYKFELMYPFDGNVGFIGGSNREQADRNAFTDGKREGFTTAYKNEQAYIFRTIDDGKTFTRQTLGHGIVNSMRKVDNSYYINVHEADTYITHTFRSDDFGKSWNKLGNFRIEAMFDKNRFIYVLVKSVSRSKRSYTYFYTKDGGKTSKPLDEKLVAYYKKSLTDGFEVYQGHLVFLIDETIIIVNIDTLEETRKTPKRPAYQTLNLLEVDRENGEIYIFVQDMTAKLKKYSRIVQESIWYPFTNEFVKFDKDIPHTLILKVRGDYIGGLLKYRGLLTHIWTMDKGKTWQFEMLSHYFWNTVFTEYRNNQIYMEAIVKGKEGVEKGSYLIMGKIK